MTDDDLIGMLGRGFGMGLVNDVSNVVTFGSVEALVKAATVGSGSMTS